MKLRRMEPRAFYAMAGKALFGSKKDIRFTKIAAVKSGDSCSSLIHDIWIAVQNKDDRKWSKKTWIVNAAKWRRLRRWRELPSNLEALPSDIIDGRPELDDSLHDDELKTAIAKLIKTLPRIEADVVAMRFGLGETPSSELKKRCQTSPNYMSEVYRRAIERIQTTYRRKIVEQHAIDRGFANTLSQM